MWNMLLQAASFSVSDPRCPMWNCNLPRNRSDLPGDSRRSSADSETNRSRQYQNVTMWNHNPMKSRCSPRVLSVLQWFEKSDRDDRVVFRWETCSGQLRQQRLVSSRAEEAWISRVLIVFLYHNLCFLYVLFVFWWAQEDSTCQIVAGFNFLSRTGTLEDNKGFCKGFWWGLKPWRFLRGLKSCRKGSQKMLQSTAWPETRPVTAYCSYPL